MMCSYSTGLYWWYFVLAAMANQPPTVVKIRRRGGVVVQGCDVYIGRACFRGGWELPQSKWYNPFTVLSSGSAAAAVRSYERYIRDQPDLLESIPELYGKTLGCWCKTAPAVPCHGDVLVALATERLAQNR